MQTIQEPITGQEYRGDRSSPFQALAYFYSAFNNRDIAAMSDNWAQSDDVAMDNPLGGIKRGWNEIKTVYERLFNGPGRAVVEFYDYTIHESGEMFYAVGRERGYFKTGDTELALAIRTSRLFRKVNGTWKQVHHHGSIDDPGFLSQYQSAVFGKKP